MSNDFKERQDEYMRGVRTGAHYMLMLLDNELHPELKNTPGKDYLMKLGKDFKEKKELIIERIKSDFEPMLLKLKEKIKEKDNE